MGSFRRRLSLLASDVVLDGEACQIGPTALSCLLSDTVEVGMHCVHADVQALRDVGVGLALGHEL